MLAERGADAREKAHVAVDGVDDAVAIDRSHDARDLCAIDRLRQYAVHSGGEATIAFFALRVRGDCVDRRSRAALARPKSPRHFDTVDDGQLHIHEDDVVTIRFEQRKRARAVCCNHHFVSESPQRFAGELLTDDVVFDEQHMHPHRRDPRTKRNARERRRGEAEDETASVEKLALGDRARNTHAIVVRGVER